MDVAESLLSRCELAIAEANSSVSAEKSAAQPSKEKVREAAAQVGELRQMWKAMREDLANTLSEMQQELERSLAEGLRQHMRSQQRAVHDVGASRLASHNHSEAPLSTGCGRATAPQRTVAEEQGQAHSAEAMAWPRPAQEKWHEDDFSLGSVTAWQ